MLEEKMLQERESWILALHSLAVCSGLIRESTSRNRRTSAKVKLIACVQANHSPKEKCTGAIWP